MFFAMVAESEPVTVVTGLEIKIVAAVLAEKNVAGHVGAMGKKALMIITEKEMSQDPARVVEQEGIRLVVHAGELEGCDAILAEERVK